MKINSNCYFTNAEYSIISRLRNTLLNVWNIPLLFKSLIRFHPIQWPRGLRRGSAAARLLGLRVRILPSVEMSVSRKGCVLSGRVRLKPDGTRWRTGGEVKRKLANGVGSQYSYTTSEHGVSSINNADAHTSAASSRLNWRPRRFKWTRPFRRKTKSGYCACAITFQTQSKGVYTMFRGSEGYWLPTPFASFPFTSPPVRHRVPSGFSWTLTPF